ncbi:metal ABC transporter solute-binding protein, Zn/Mn family [Nocardioides sp. zg-1228]|uniref:metal ABC transporter solute-binding protein, Zn/Mn family n=1 Tax=Nocardioides sp. zg-1228 TaxID=2763008 RepID=UPI001642BA72|nr:zinc ABC transporter substrate-binding protein [Nocardioides sp. zg-1228]MBC2934201.1 zinc ABC transporter substrate-binding protein [Nocardioides sp. zg-1228]QSF58945.1 zinc ABC transporter substrate-binding protein [Nocardioides sp. zg-1228]
MSPRPLALAATLASTALLAACGGSGDTSGSDGSRHSAVAAFYPLAWVTEEVAGDDWDVTNLTAPGSEPHDLSLDIRQTAAVAEADLVVLEHDFQPAVDATVEANAGDAAVLDAAEVLELMPTSDHDHAHDEAGHDHGELDPHFWLDPLLMADLGDAVAEQLAEIDPDRAATYRDNAAALREELEALDQQYADGLAECARTTTVVSHEAFSYLSRYGLQFEAIAGLSPDAEPTPADLARLQELIREEGITTVFSERLASSKMADSLAGDLGLATAVLDPIEGLSDDTADDDYLSLMGHNLEALRKANGCR